MKKAIALTLTLAMAVTMAGCGNNQKGTVTSASGKKISTDLIKGSIKLADYKGLEVYEDEIKVEDTEVQSQIDNLLKEKQDSNVVTKGKVVESDTVNIDYTGTIKLNGEDFKFDGGSATNYDLDLDNSQFIDGFAEGLVGHEVGEEVTLNLKFPKDYSQTSKDADGNELTLAGKKVKFVVKINSRKVLPELTDKFVKKNYKKQYGTKTVDELKSYISNQLRTNKIVNAVFSDYVDKCDVTAYDEKEVESIEDFNNSAMASRLQSQYKTNLDTYLKACKMSKKDWNKKMEDSAQKTAKQAMVIEGIAISEGLWASEKDYNAGLKKVATSMGYKSVDELESYFTQYQAYYGQVIIKESVAFNEAVNQLIADNAKILEGSRPADETTTEETTAE
ncbi:FKBP-type peptidyl-prolyl cis-trans isomerase [uncultured Eubacterium sp.]|uniref:FKBP-type peptidyl-prolyl cis-trans isomerase n=1 Tax=uncultured Eubacterium sp. TaxID=165185 RepID=UPI003267482F